MRKLVLLLLGVAVFCCQLLAQNRTITGKVTDINGIPLANVSVLIRGTNVGTVTKMDGTYSITIPTTARVLLYSSVDMTTQEIAVGKESVIDVSLKLDEKNMREVVVVGYQQRRKRDEAGAISSVRGADIENKPNVSLDKALQGRAAGVLVQSNNGIPGGAINVRIRGLGSFLAGTQPLYIVDGVRINTRNDASFTQSNPLSFLNPDDIESIDVLKDASASIYGASAANGVIIITTKKGKAGKTKFEFNTYVGQCSPIQKLDVLNSQEYIQLRTEAYLYQNFIRTTLAAKNIVLAELRLPTYTTEKSADSAIAAQKTYDWQDAVFRRGKIQNYEMSASGGNDRTTFRISGSYTKQEAVITKADFTRGTVKLDLTNKATDRLIINTSINLSTSNQKIPFATDGSFLGSPAFAGSAQLPINPIYNADGTYAGLPPNNLIGILNQNVVSVNDFNKGYQRTNQAIGNISLDYKLFEWLTFRSFYGLDYRLVQGKSFRDPRTPDVFARKGLGQVANNWNTNFLTYQTLNLNKTFNDIHRLDGVLGAEYKSENNEGISTSAEGFPTYQFTTLNTAATPLTAAEFFTGFRTAGYFTSVNYSLDGRYIVSGILRYDYSSRFGANHRWGLFPGIKLAWNIDDEKFMKSQTVFSQLRLRASWGVSGNDQIGNFDALGLYGGGPVYNGSAGITFSQLANPELKWERNETTNFGLDFSLFNSRVNSSIEIYQKLTKDALLNLPVQWTTGFGQITSNIGEIQNRGVELTIGGDVLRSRYAGGLRWNTNFIFTYNKNIVKKLYSGLQELPGDPATRVDRSLGSVFTFLYAGVNAATGRPMWLDSLKNLTYQTQARDRVYIGDNQPEFWGGWNNTFSYRGFTLDVFCNYEYGRLAQDGQVLFLTENIARLNELQVVYENRWTTPGQITTWPRMNANGSESKGSGAQTGDRSWFKADYIRLKTITISYDVPESVYKRLHINRARFYVQGTNLYTFSDTYSYDVEFFNASTGIIPQSKMMTVGFQFSF